MQAAAYQPSTINTQTSKLRMLERVFGDLDDHFARDQLQGLEAELKRRPISERVKAMGYQSDLAQLPTSVRYYRKFRLSEDADRGSQDPSNDEILRHFDAVDPRFELARRNWPEETLDGFCDVARVVHAAGYDWWMIDKRSQYECRFGRKKPGQKTASIALGYIGLMKPWLSFNPKGELTRVMKPQPVSAEAADALSLALSENRARIEQLTGGAANRPGNWPTAYPFERSESGDGPDMQDDLNMDGSELFASYEKAGFFFGQDVITRYALSLSAKPFAILSGVSGTGKTKIAQLFDPTPSQPLSEAPAPAATPKRDKIVLYATDGFRTGDGRGNLANEHMGTVFEKADLDRIRERSAELVAEGRTDNVIDPINLTVDTPEGGSLTLGLYVQRPQSPLIRVRARSKAREVPDYDSRAYFEQHYKPGEPIELEKVGPYHFRVVRSGAETISKLRDDFIADQARAVRTNNKLFIPVQSNWTDRTELFGYFNQIEGRYASTPLLRLIRDAMDNPNVPFFLILDEMNLSKVEHYFSDFLSCLESRICRDSEVEQEPIQLHNRGEFVEADDPLLEEVPARLFLPLNLYVTGTVNVDETTYMFSPKVLDRANVIEFNDVELGHLEGAEGATHSDFALRTVPTYAAYRPVTATDYVNAPSAVKQMLEALVAILKPHSLHFGYRVAQEVARFVNLAREHIGDTETVITAAADVQIVQKVLPKFSGSQAELELPLKQVLVLLLQQGGEQGTPQVDDLSPSWLEANASTISNSPYPLASEKIARMLRDLYVSGFTNFIG
jgi:hypothetical protein